MTKELSVKCLRDCLIREPYMVHGHKPNMVYGFVSLWPCLCYVASTLQTSSGLRDKLFLCLFVAKKIREIRGCFCFLLVQRLFLLLTGQVS